MLSKLLNALMPRQTAPATGSAYVLTDFPANHSEANPVSFQKAKEMAEKDFDAHLGLLVSPPLIMSPDLDGDVAGYDGLICRVVATCRDDLHHETGSHLDPYWDLEIVADPEGRCKGAELLYTFGPSIPLL